MMDEIGNIKGAAAVVSGEADPETMGISAPDDKTFEWSWKCRCPSSRA